MIRNIRLLLCGLLSVAISCSSSSEEPAPAPAPNTPTRLAAPQPTVSGETAETAFTIEWNAVANADYYRCTIDGKEEQTVRTTRLSVSGRTPDTSYTVRVQACSDDETKFLASEWGSATVRTAAPTVRKEYKLVWSDEFDGTELDRTVWDYQLGGGGFGNQEKQYYTDRPENVRVEEGCLVIEARKEQYENNSYTSGRINSKNRKAFAYGKFEARLQLAKGTGTWSAYWMMGNNYDIYRWPACGEIDIMEHVGKEPTMISHALHTSEANGTNGRNWNSRKYIDGIEEGFHTYTFVWEKDWDNGDDLLQFLVDGEVTAQRYQPHGATDYKVWPFDKEFFLIFNLAIGGTWGGAIDDSIFNEPVQMKVDYIRVYQRVD